MVDEAENGCDCLNRLAHADYVHANYDVVLLDYMISGITGLTVLFHIQVRYPSVSVIAMIGHPGGQIAGQAVAAGARACLTKPFDAVELEQALKCCAGIAASAYLVGQHESAPKVVRQGMPRSVPHRHA
ncbi:response regulator [Nitrospira sp. NS4]|uniref:response regulator n=1 Tax=Nitrospira sp. NS4 TaxID=3414498 RepID=UPI003C2B96D7